MRFKVNVEHRLTESDVEAELLGESYIDAGVVRVEKREVPGIDLDEGCLSVAVTGEAPVILDWLLNHWNLSDEAIAGRYPGGNGARLAIALEAMKSALPLR